MARTMRGHLTAPLQPEGTEEPETNPSVSQWEEQPHTAEGKVIVDYDLYIDYDESEPKNEPVTQKEKEKTLTLNMQTWRYLAKGHSDRG